MKRAIVVGASSGIGREVALLMLEEGWTLGIAARREERLEEIRRSFLDRVHTAVIDVCSANACDALLELLERMGGMDVYVHVAGVGKQNALLEEGVEEHTVATNTLGFTRLVDTAFGYMAEHGGGHIAVVSSIAGTKGLGVAPSYSATKAFQNNYVEALSQLARLRGLPISFTDIRPGFVDTDLLGTSHRYPMLMKKEKVARAAFRAIKKKRRVCIIDWRYRVLVAFWRLIPGWLWVRMPVKTKEKAGYSEVSK